MGWNNYKSDVVNWTKISEKTAALILDQAQTVLKETVETAKAISTRSDRLIAIQIPIATAIVVFLFGSKTFGYLQLSALICLTIVIVSFLYAYKSFRHYEIAIPGEVPKITLTSEYIDNELDDKQQYLQILINLCENLQQRIEMNDDCNSYRIEKNKKALNSLLFIPFSPILAFLLQKAFCAPHS